MERAQGKAGLGGVPREGGSADVILPVLKQYAMLGSLLVLVTLMVGFHYALRGFHGDFAADGSGAGGVPVADPARGPGLLHAYGCVGCHTVPGVPGANGKVGPRLDRLREQAFVAGVLPNSPQNLADWIRRPRDIDPDTAMPNLGVTEIDARDLAAYLSQQP